MVRGLAIIYLLLGLIGGGMVVAGLRTGSGVWLLGGLVALVLVGASAPLGFLLGRQVDNASQLSRRMSELLEHLHEHAMLTDNAKRVLFRDRELQLLRNAIEDDIGRGDYNAAVTLCEEMANLFGYREEAEAFRSRIGQARQAHYEAQIQVEMSQFEAYLSERNWAAVHQQAARIRRLYPDSHFVGDLDQRVRVAREEHKRELEGEFLSAAQRGEVERAMALLKRLDLYLDRAEAERLTKVAQEVIVKHREHLGDRFREAVNEHRWAEAASLGETIIAEFPNSKMANEVRSMMEHLRVRAEQGPQMTQR